MPYFEYRSGILHAEDVSLLEIAEQAGTPVYIYSSMAMEHSLNIFRNAFVGLDIGIFYAMKANGNLAVLKTLAQAGAGADVVSQGELRKALYAGIVPEKIIYSGVGKTDEDLEFAISAGIYQINIETEQELQRIDVIAQEQNKKPAVALRVNPAVGAGGHAKITTGLESSKFGVNFNDVERLYKKAAATESLQLAGLAVHIGSQIHELEPLREAFIRLRHLAESLRAEGLPVPRLDLGGGLSVCNIANNDETKRLAAYAQMVREVMNGLDAELNFEPGRLLMANAGILLTKVVATSRRPQKTFLVVDAGMNDLLRPALYDARHDIIPVLHQTDVSKLQYEVVGPVCESSDSFGEDFLLPQQEPGDFLAILSTGAYGSAMSSTYNQRPLIAEVMVRGREWSVTRTRQSYDELIRNDRLPPWL